MYELFMSFVDAAQRTLAVLAISIPAYAVIALTLWAFSDARRKDASPAGAARAVFPPEVYRSASWRVDFWHALLSIALWGKLLSLLFAVFVGTGINELLVARFGARAPLAGPAWLVVACQFVPIVLARDFAFYVGHFLTHTVPFLWRVHRPHHSAEHMSVFTSYRLHPLDRAFVRIFHMSMGALVTGLALYGTGSKLQPGTLALLAGWATMISIKTLFDHGNFPISYGPLNWIVSSPAMHRVHHSATKRHWDKNMGEVFSLWDWIFGTIYVPTKGEVKQMGTRFDEIGEANPHKTLRGFYLEPLATMGAMLKDFRWEHFKVQSTVHLDDDVMPPATPPAPAVPPPSKLLAESGSRRGCWPSRAP